METTREMIIPGMFGRSRRKTRRARKSEPRVNVVAGMKWCNKCQTRKPVDAFGVARDRHDGLNAYCRTCRTASRRHWRTTNIATARADVRARHAANPELSRAKRAVQRALANGLVERPAPGTPCDCGRVAPLEAHHHLGHAKEHHLDIVWRCRSCRALADATARAVEISVSEISVSEISPCEPSSYPTLKPVAPRWAKLGAHGVPAKKVG